MKSMAHRNFGKSVPVKQIYSLKNRHVFRPKKKVKKRAYV